MRACERDDKCPFPSEQTMGNPVSPARAGSLSRTSQLLTYSSHLFTNTPPTMKTHQRAPEAPPPTQPGLGP